MKNVIRVIDGDKSAVRDFSPALSLGAMQALAPRY
ncbi:hypothetical protein FHR47_001665 [Xanthomonas arboricola]|nr:hypothetical protein [Xanthomonas cannabis]